MRGTDVDTLRRRFEAARFSGDSGVAIVAAMAVVMLVGILLAVVVAIAVSEARQTGRDRQRSSAVATAEGRVDVVTAQIQSSTPTALGTLCGTLAGTADVASDDFALQTTITYYAAGTEVPCASVPTTELDQAKIEVTATANQLAGTSQAERNVEQLVDLTPTYKAGLDKAIFSNWDLTSANKTVLQSGAGVPDADVYTNGNFQCLNNQEYQGSVYAQGFINAMNNCTIAVDAWAKGPVSFFNSVSVGGRVLSATGSIWLDKASVGQQARARLDITGEACDTAGKCVPNVQVDAPPQIDFPQFVWDSTAQADWAAAGYTNVVQLPTSAYPCGLWTGPGGPKGDGSAVWLAENGATLPADTVLVVDCPWSKVWLIGLDVSLNKNIVVISRSGFDFTNTTKFTSVAGTATAADPNLFYMIQPYTGPWGAYTCLGEGITLANQVTFDKTINTLLYSPCPIRKTNNSTIFGQIYSGQSVLIQNQFDMTYYPMEIPGGLGATPDDIESYSVEVQYKREGQ